MSSPSEGGSSTINAGCSPAAPSRKATEAREQAEGARAATCCGASALARVGSSSASKLVATTTAHLLACSPAAQAVGHAADESLVGTRESESSELSSPKCSLNFRREATRQQQRSGLESERSQGQQQLSQSQQSSSFLILQQQQRRRRKAAGDTKKRRSVPFEFEQPQRAPFSSLVAFCLFALFFVTLNSPARILCKSVSRESSAIQQTSNEINKSPPTRLEDPEEATTTKTNETSDPLLVVEVITTPAPRLKLPSVDTLPATEASPISATTQQRPSTPIEGGNEKDEEERDDPATTTEHDADDAEGCESVSADESAKNLTDNERLVNLQTCFQKKVKRNILSAARSGMDLFDKLSLSGGCSSSLMSLMSNLGQLKSFAFKFIDASAKIPSGVMLGLLSDYGDFDECLSIRSNPLVEPEEEVEERAYSGKYCLLSINMNYHVKLEPNETVPKGIIEDGIFWDQLVRRYWTSNSTKGFQLGMCFPSRCTNDDLEQIYKQVAQGSSFSGEIISCQSSLELKHQYKPDLIQRLIIYLICVLIGLTTVGTFIDRYWPHLAVPSNCRNSSPSLSSDDSAYSGTTATSENNRSETFSQTVAPFFRILICFSIIKNWSIFIGNEQQLESSQQWDCFTNSSENAICHDPASTSATLTAISREAGFRLDPLTATTENTDLSNMTMDSSSLKQQQQQRKNITIDSSKSEDQKLHQLTGNFQLPAAPARSPSPTATARLYLKRAQAPTPAISLSHLSGLKLIVILWITIGHSFLYPSAHNYQYYRSIISMKLTRDSVWFAITNFTLGVDMILYMSGLVFVYKVANLNLVNYLNEIGEGSQKNASINRMAISSGFSSSSLLKLRLSVGGVGRVISKKILRLWPTYLSLIALAILIPMLNDGPLWPEMVSKRLGQSCRKNWWSNLLFINNFGFGESEICLPSSWFISVLMQLFLIGSIIIALIHLISLEFALTILILLLFGSCAGSFAYAYWLKLGAPVIKLDETFVMELDENIFGLYTNTINNLGPFLTGMVGGFILVCAQVKHESSKNQIQNDTKSVSTSTTSSRLNVIAKRSTQALIDFTMLLIALSVLSSVFYLEYSRFWASIYWALHRVGWAIATGYLIHNCATGRWLLLKDLLSLSSFIPLSKLIFIAYLVNPIYIHIHSGLVRDGLHISTYNMLNIYTTRLVMTFVTALLIHLLVELPFNSIEEIYFNNWISGHFRLVPKAQISDKFRPLLATVLPCESKTKESAQEMTSLDGKKKEKQQELQQQ